MTNYSWQEKLRDFKGTIEAHTIDPVRNLLYRIKLTWDWYKHVLRYDGDWDWVYIVRVLKYKLERTRKCLEQGHHLYADRDARQIRICEMLLERIEKDDYRENAFVNHDKKWGEMSIRWKPTDDLGLTESVFSRPNVTTPEQDEQELKERKLLYTHSDYMAKQDLEYLGKLLTKYLKIGGIDDTRNLSSPHL